VTVAPAPAPEGRLGLAFTVQDSGIGIPADRIEKLFMPFTQADTSTTRRHGGTGLGLSICRRLVEAMGGTVTVDSIAGRGSTFRFGVLLDAGAQAESTRGPALSGPLRALLVDDHPVNLRILSAKLESFGVQVWTAGNAEDALHCWRDLHAAGETVHVAIMDHHLPDHDGERLAREIRALDATTASRLVLMSSLCSVLPSTCDGLFDRVISKPIKRQVLLRTLEELLGSAVPPSNPADLAAGRLQGLRALLVDDNAVNQKLGQRLLEKLGMHVTQAWNGLEAIEHLRRQHFDVVLMDCQMPEMDGFEATRTIRRA
jgi:ammonium transporter, Amt family